MCPCLSVYIHECAPTECHKKASDPLELELQVLRTELRASERAAHALITETALQPLFLGLVILTICLLWSVGGMLYLMLIVIVYQIHALQVSPVIQFLF